MKKFLNLLKENVTKFDVLTETIHAKEFPKHCNENMDMYVTIQDMNDDGINFHFQIYGKYGYTDSGTAFYDWDELEKLV